MEPTYTPQAPPSMLVEDPRRKQKWEILTKGLEEEHGQHLEDPGLVRRATEIALESMVALLSGSVMAGGVGRDLTRVPADRIQEAIDSSAIAPFQKMSLGIVRRMVPLLLGPDSLVSVQPIPLPSAPIFYLQFLYGTAKAPTTVGTRIDTIATRNETFAGGRHWDLVTASAPPATSNFDLDNAGTQQHQVYKDGVLLTLATDYAIAAGAGAGGVDQLQLVAPTVGAEVILVSYIGYVEGDTPRDLDLSLTSEIVTAEDQALRGGFSVQAMQDAQAYHSMSLDKELSAAMAYELLAETDYNIVKELFEWAGAGNVNWDSTGYLAGDTSTADRREYRRTLYEAIVEANDLVFSLRHRDVSWIVGGTAAIQRLTKLENFQLLSGAADNLKAVTHRIPLGTLAGSYKVYKDSRMPSNKLLLGYKGPSPFHVGYVYAPYVMAYMTGLMPDPNATFNMKRGLLTRAARKRVDMGLYSTVTIT